MGKCHCKPRRKKTPPPSWKEYGKGVKDEFKSIGKAYMKEGKSFFGF